MNLLGQQISHYQVLEKLGSGGMGIVYKAQDTRLGRFVALKFLNKDLLGDAESRQRFINEARTISSLDHPNIVTVHEIDETEEYVFICMAYYEGQSLDHYLAAKGNLELEEILDIVVQVGEGLAAAHEKGILHRDIKPGNIMITPAGQAKILDFGLAKMSGQTQLTQVDSLVGTAAYMSPEQVQGEDLDHRTDIFSLGVVLYEMATGERPFQGDYLASVAYSIVNEGPRPVTEIRPDLPEPFQHVIAQALQKDRDARYESCAALVADLRKLQGRSAAELGQPAAKPVRPRLSMPKKVAAGLIGLILLLTITWFTRQPTGSNADGQTSIAVLPFRYESGDAEWSWLGEVLTELTNKELSQNPNLRIVDGPQRVRLMRSLGLRNDDLDVASALRLASKARTQHVVVGRLARTDGALRLQAEVYAQNGNLVAKLDPVEARQDQVALLATSLTLQLGRILHQAQPGVEKAKPAEISLEVYRYWLEGRDAGYDGRFQESIAKLEKVVALDPTFADAYPSLAFAYDEVGENARALEVLRKGKAYISQLPEKARLQYLRTEAQIEGRWRDYVVYLQQLLNLDPYDASEHFRYGWTQHRKFRNFDAGIKSMLRAVELDSTYTIAYNYLAYAYLELGQNEKAFEMIERYITLSPANLNPLDSKAEMLFLTGRYEEAIELCNRILTLQPDFVLTPLILARAYAALGKYPRAHDVIDRYIATAPGAKFKSSGLSVKAEILLRQGRLNEALRNAETAISLRPENAGAHWVRGRALARRQEGEALERAIADFERAVFSGGGLDDRWYWLYLKGEAAWLRNRPEQAVAFFQQALALFPKERSFFQTALARAYERAGQRDNAEATYTAALRTNPNNAIAHFELGELYRGLGRMSQAQRHYQRVVEIWAGMPTPNEQLRSAKRNLTAL